MISLRKVVYHTLRLLSRRYIFQLMHVKELLLIKQLKNESEDAYLAFLSYVNADGVSLDAAYKLFCDDAGIETELVPDIWLVWFSKYSWDARLQTQKDSEDDGEAISPTDYNKRLAAFQARQSKLNDELSKATRLLLRRVRSRLITLDPDEIPAGAIPNYINSVAKIAELFTKNEADQLALEELMEALDSLKEEKAQTKKPIIKPVSFNFEKLTNAN